MIHKKMGSIRRKILIATFIPLIIWLIAIVLFYYYSDMMERNIFPTWGFSVVTFPLCLGSIAIYYTIMTMREIMRENKRKLQMIEEK
jgi:CHASE3 domain sensor protein